MNRIESHDRRRERMIGILLWYGTLLASTIIATGIALHMLQRSGHALAIGVGGSDVVTTGVALFILLPIARVVVMLGTFMRERDYAYIAISALVLAIIAGGVVVGR